MRLGRAEWVGASAVPETATYLQRGGDVPVAFRFSDRLRPGAEGAVAAFREAGIATEVVSGDADTPVAGLARRLGIETYRANVTPQDKADRIAELATEGRRVLMVGDGMNDTAALAVAHVSVSPATALDAARVASDIVFLGKSMSSLGDALHTARRARARIKENFAISTIYNVVAVPFALFGFATPLIAALAMSTSSITVSLNAMRVR